MYFLGKKEKVVLLLLIRLLPNKVTLFVTDTLEHILFTILSCMIAHIEMLYFFFLLEKCNTFWTWSLKFFVNLVYTHKWDFFWTFLNNWFFDRERFFSFPEFHAFNDGFVNFNEVMNLSWNSGKFLAVSTEWVYSTQPPRIMKLCMRNLLMKWKISWWNNQNLRNIKRSLKKWIKSLITVMYWIFFCRISKQKTIRHYPLNVCQFRAWGQLQTFPVRCLARCVTEKWQITPW